MILQWTAAWYELDQTIVVGDKNWFDLPKDETVYAAQTATAARRCWEYPKRPGRKERFLTANSRSNYIKEVTL